VNDKQTQTAKTLYKKLSALRATLSDEEQALLDNMITGEFDVQGHKFGTTKPTTRWYDTDETEGHKMSVSKASVGKASVGDTDETEGHKMSVSKASVGKASVGDTDETEGHTMPRSPKRVVVYNPDQEVYEIKIEDTI